MFLNLRRFSKVCLLAALAVSVLAAAPAEAAKSKKQAKPRPTVDRFAEIVIEASSGYVISEKNADRRLYPASLTKMMTLYMAFDAIEQGKLSKNQRVYVSRRAASQEPSSLALAEGQTVRVEDCILGMATKSANDCAVVLGEAIGGSEPRFAMMMTAKARQLGMSNTNFVNASGLHNKMQYSSARDMAKLSQALIKNHAKYYSYFRTPSFTYRGDTYLNHNKLMATYRGMDGLKTGYVYASGYNLAASAVRNGTRLIGVIFGGQTAKSRNNAMAHLLDDAFMRISNVNVAALPVQQSRPVAAPRQLVAPEPGPDVVIAEAAPPKRLHIDQGDADITMNDESRAFFEALKPQPINTTPVGQKGAQVASMASGNWAIQIGAFSTHGAGEQALQMAHSSLQGVVRGVDTIAPLMTPRGMIYRARVSGLARNGAVEACRILKGNCVVLAVE